MSHVFTRLLLLSLKGAETYDAGFTAFVAVLLMHGQTSSTTVLLLPLVYSTRNFCGFQSGSVIQLCFHFSIS